MSATEVPRIKDLGSRGQAYANTLELYLRAELVEAIQTNRKPARKQKGKQRTLTDIMLSMLGNVTPKQKQQMVRRMMNSPLATGGPLSARDKSKLNRTLQPGAKSSVEERFGLAKEIDAIFNPPKNLDPNKKRDRLRLRRFTDGLAADLLGRSYRHHDGREEDHPDEEPKDKNPKNPDDNEPTAPNISVPYDKLTFNVSRVRCLEPTKGESGKDEISMAVLGGQGELAYDPTQASLEEEPDEGFPPDDPSRGLSAEVIPYNREIHSAGDFGRGEQQHYNPTKLMQTWDTSNLDMPQFFVAHFSMAEIDPRGGFAEYLAELHTGMEVAFRNLSAERGVPAAIFGSLLAVGTGVAIGVSIGAGAALGAALGGVIGVAIGVVVALIWLAAVWHGNRDDIFEPRTFVLVLDQIALQAHPFNGRRVTNFESFIIEGDGGRYEVDYQWQLREPNDPRLISDDDSTSPGGSPFRRQRNRGKGNPD